MNNYSGYKVDHYQVQSGQFEAFEVLFFQGSNVVGSMDAVSESQANFFGQKALAGGTDAAYAL